MKRIECNSVTDTIAKAMEEAGDMDRVLILVRRKGGDDDHAVYDHYSNAECTQGEANFLVDSFKAWLFGCFVEREGD
jgi:hypothetical protein